MDQQVDRNAFTHAPISLWRRMQMIAGIHLWAQMAGMKWIGENAVKIDHSIECTSCANPRIELQTILFGTLRWVIVIGSKKRSERSTYDASTVRMRFCGHLSKGMFKAFNQGIMLCLCVLCNAIQTTNIIDAFK